MKRLSRVTAMFLAVLMLSASLVGCASRALPTTKEDLRVVGTVGEYDVLYEEFRFLVLTYKKQLEDLHGKDIWEKEETAAEYRRELKKLVYEDLTANYAVLTLGAKEGLSVDDFEDEVQDYMEKTLRSDFDDDRGSYKDFLKAAGLTDHYVRFTVAVDTIYEELYFKYLEDGRVSDDRDTVKRYILQNFVRVASICLINKTDEENDVNRKKAEQYREEVADGADIDDYVKYTLDMSPEHCFTHGQMDETYEEIAFALESVGDISEVFYGTADYLGDTRGAWYFMEKLSLTESYVETNYAELFDSYASALMNNYLNEARETLTFVPNEECKALDLLSIEPIESVKDDTWVIYTVSIVGGILVIAGAVIVFMALNRKPKTKKKAK